MYDKCSKCGEIKPLKVVSKNTLPYVWGCSKCFPTLYFCKDRKESVTEFRCNFCGKHEYANK